MSDYTILIADDDDDIVDVLSTRCRGMGLWVETAGDAMDALRKIDQKRPDVVILDVNMPCGNGLSVREMMACNTELSAIPVIILTGNSDKETILRCHNTCAYYIPKGPDAWSRIEPLLLEILESIEQIADPQPKSSKKTRHDSEESIGSMRWMGELIDCLAENLMECGARERDAVADEEPFVAESRPPWVMCIDDDSELTFGLQMRLREHGIEVLRAFKGMEGYRHAFICNPQAIILDYEMPEGNGDYVLRRLQESPATQDIPVIVLTGRNDRAIERKMYNLGAKEFLTKPCAWDTLWPALQRYIEVPEPA